MATFNKGESVKMKNGTMDAEYEKWDLSGWIGWVVATPKRGQSDTYQILWDTETFKKMPLDFIEQSNEDQDEWDVYYTVESEIEKAFARGTMKDAEKTAKEWREKYPQAGD
jgi:hypothetical protein